MRYFLIAIALTLATSSINKASAQSSCPSIMDNGGNNTGTANNDTAYITTAGLGPSGQSCVYFPARKYNFASQATINLSGTNSAITVEGAGQEVTQLYWSGGGGLKFNLNSGLQSVHLRNMTIMTGSVGVGHGVELNLTVTNDNPSLSAQNDVSNITLRGADGYQESEYWLVDIYVNSASNIVFDNVNMIGASTPAGVGVDLVGASIDDYATQQVFFAPTMTGLTYGIYRDSYVQGTFIYSGNWTANSVCVYIPSTAAGNIGSLSLFGGQCNSTVAGIEENAAVEDSLINGVLFLVNSPGGTGIAQAASGLFTISNNMFYAGTSTPSGQIAISAGGTLSSLPGQIVGNSFFGFSTAINLGSTLKNVTVGPNIYAGNTSNIANAAGFNNNAIEGGRSNTLLGTGTTTVSGLSSLDPSPVVGDRAFVTDATACTFNQAVNTGGGTKKCPVVYSGSGWVAG